MLHTHVHAHDIQRKHVFPYPTNRPCSRWTSVSRRPSLYRRRLELFTDASCSPKSPLHVQHQRSITNDHRSLSGVDSKIWISIARWRGGAHGMIITQRKLYKWGKKEKKYLRHKYRDRDSRDRKIVDFLKEREGIGRLPRKLWKISYWSNPFIMNLYLLRFIHKEKNYLFSYLILNGKLKASTSG